MSYINPLIWNHQTDTCVTVAAKAHPAFPLKVMAICLMTSLGTNGFALPAGGTVSAGGATISTGANTTTITQSTQNAAINWQSFNIGQTETVNFLQPNTGSVALNRVTGSNPSNIFGSLSSNGKVFLVNPNGILFGKTAQVNVGGLVASTLNITDADFMARNYNFVGGGNGKVQNQGAINTNSDGGYIALLGANVSNDGIISARLGTVALAAGTAITLDVAGDGLLNITVNQGAVNALVQNSGLIQADGGVVLLTAQAAGNLLATVVNNTGHIQAQTIQSVKGSIKMLGDMQNGIVNVGGTLDASAPNGGNGGFIETSAAHVRIANNANITTSAPYGLTGTWLVDPFDFTIAAGSDIAGTTLSGMLVTNSIVISTLAGTNSATNLYATTNGNGDIFVNEAVSWIATGLPTTLTLNAARDVNINAAITATNGNVVSTAGRNVNTSAAVKTTNGSITSTAGNNANINAAITTVTGGFTANAGNNVAVTAAVTTTTGDVILRGGNKGNGVGTVVFSAPGAVTLNTGNAYIYYNPSSYATPTSYTSYFTGNGTLNSYMWVFTQGNSKVYDGSNTATLSFVGDPTTGGVVTLVDPGSGATFSDKNAANGKTITYSGFTLAGANANRFALYNAGTTTANITTKALTINGISASNKVYDGSNSATINSGAASYNGLISGDAVTVTSTGTFADKNAANGKTVTLTNLYSGLDASNYSITSQANTTANITTKALTISGITTVNKVYDSSNSATINSGAASYNGLVSGDAVTVASTGVFADKNVANGKTVTLSSLYSGADLSNYNITSQANTTANITTKALTISGITAGNKVYDGSNSATVNSSAANYSGLVSGDAITVTSTGTFADKNAANGKTVTLANLYGGLDANNYNITSQASTTANISTKALTISGISASNKVYDGSNSATVSSGAASYNGLVSGDAVAVSSTGLFSDKNIANGKTVTLTNLYSGQDIGNYNITGQATTTANITAAALTVLIAPPIETPVATPLPLTIKPAPPSIVLLTPVIPAIAFAAIDFELNLVSNKLMAETLSDQNYDFQSLNTFVAGKYQIWHGAYLAKTDLKSENTLVAKRLAAAKAPPAKILLTKESMPAKESAKDELSFINIKIVGNPLDGGKFAKLKIGMSMKQVEELIGAPDWTWQQFTGADSTPYYTGTERKLFQYTYKSEGMLTFSFGQEPLLIRMLVNRAG